MTYGVWCVEAFGGDVWSLAFLGHCAAWSFLRAAIAGLWISGGEFRRSLKSEVGFLGGGFIRFSMCTPNSVEEKVDHQVSARIQFG